MMPETRRIMTLQRCRGRLNDREVASVFGEIWEYFRQFFSPKSRYYVLTFRDPAPFFADMIFAVERVWCLYLQSRGGSVVTRP
jgi:hypothetical protein